MFRRGLGWIDDYDVSNLASNVTHSLASTLNKDNLQRAWDISAGAVSAIAETSERAIRATQQGGQPSWISQQGPSSLPSSGGIGEYPGRKQHAYNNPSSSGGYQGALGAPAFQAPTSVPVNLYTQPRKEKKKSKKHRKHASDSEEEPAKHKKKSRNKKVDSFYSEPSESETDASDAREREREKEKERKKLEKYEREKARQKEEEDREREKQRVRDMWEKEKEVERVKQHEREQVEEEASRHHKEKKKGDKKKKKKHEKREKSEKSKKAEPMPSSEDISEEERQAAPQTHVFRNHVDPTPAAPRRGEEDLDRLFGFAALDVQNRPSLLDEVFSPLPKELPKVQCPGCGLQFCLSEGSLQAVAVQPTAPGDLQRSPSAEGEQEPVDCPPTTTTSETVQTPDATLACDDVVEGGDTAACSDNPSNHESAGNEVVSTLPSDTDQSVHDEGAQPT